MYMSFRHENSPRFGGFPFFVFASPRCYFFTLKTCVFIAKRTKNRNVGPTKLRKTNVKIESTIFPRIEIIITGIRAHICQVSRFWRDIPILDPPKPKLGRSDFHFLMKKTIMITDYGNREKRYNQHITCQLARFYNKSKLNIVKPVVA